MSETDENLFEECFEMQRNELQVLESMLLLDSADSGEDNVRSDADLDNSHFTVHYHHKNSGSNDSTTASFQFVIECRSDNMNQELSGCRVRVKCNFDRAYPLKSPLRVYSIRFLFPQIIVSNKQEQMMIDDCNRYLESLSGSESTYDLITYLRDHVVELWDSVSEKKETTTDKIIDSRVCLSTVGIHFHHIYSDNKKRQIVNQAAQLGLKSGIYKFGKPGKIIIQGLKEDVDQYVSILKGLRWQKMVVKIEKYSNHEIDPQGKDKDCASNIHQFFRKYNLLLFDSFSEVVNDFFFEKVLDVGE